MGYQEAALLESDQAIIDKVLGGSPLGIGFAELKEKGTIDPWKEPLIAFADLNFPTPSGKIEMASEMAAARGLPRVPQPSAEPRPAAGRLRLLSPAGPWLMNDSYGNDPAVREQLGLASIALNASDAARLGLAEGALVEVANETGNLALTLQITDIVPEGVALSHKGRWARFEGAGGNINLLNPGEKADMGESTAVHGVEVTVRAVQSTKRSVTR
jgi:anaerobic selenocysteine-containing dehydrogenase